MQEFSFHVNIFALFGMQKYEKFLLRVINLISITMNKALHNFVVVKRKKSSRNKTMKVFPIDFLRQIFSLFPSDYRMLWLRTRIQKKFINDARSLSRLTLTFHNIQINIHIYHDFVLFFSFYNLSSLAFFLPMLAVYVLLHSRSLALEKYTTFSCNLHTVSIFYFALLTDTHLH